MGDVSHNCILFQNVERTHFANSLKQNILQQILYNSKIKYEDQDSNISNDNDELLIFLILRILKLKITFSDETFDLRFFRVLVVNFKSNESILLE